MNFEFKHITQTGETVVVGFNVDRVLTHVVKANGDVVINLDDWHDEYIEEDVKSHTGRPQGTRMVKKPVTTQLIVTGEDALTFRKNFCDNTEVDLLDAEEGLGEEWNEEINKENEEVPETETLGT